MIVKLKTNKEITNNIEAGQLRRENIAKFLPKELYALSKDVPTPSEWLYGDDITARQNAIKVSQKALNRGQNSNSGLRYNKFQKNYRNAYPKHYRNYKKSSEYWKDFQYRFPKGPRN